MDDENKRTLEERMESWVYIPREEADAKLKAVKEEVEEVMRKHKIPTFLLIFGVLSKSPDTFGTIGATAAMGDYHYLEHYAREWVEEQMAPVNPLSRLFR